jgi:hypothetical protein
MKTIFYKTEHFLYRQWDRGISDDLLNSALESITNCDDEKNILIVGNSTLRKKERGIKPNTNLVIVFKKKALITLFFVKDLYEYLSTISKKSKIIIL